MASTDKPKLIAAGPPPEEAKKMRVELLVDCDWGHRGDVIEVGDTLGSAMVCGGNAKVTRRPTHRLKPGDEGHSVLEPTPDPPRKPKPELDPLGPDEPQGAPPVTKKRK